MKPTTPPPTTITPEAQLQLAEERAQRERMRANTARAMDQRFATAWDTEETHDGEGNNAGQPDAKTPQSASTQQPPPR